MTDETIQSLSHYIANDILRQPKRPIDANMKLLSTGLIDSFSLVDLAIFVEEQFGVKISDTELNAQTFDTLNDLAHLVESRKK